MPGNIRTAVLCGLSALGVMAFAGAASTADSAPAASAKTVLATGDTILGQPLAYPTKGAPEVTSAIVTLPPGAETGWHRHDVPMYAYVLEGEVTVTYKGAGTHVYRAGDALMEAVGTPHDGRNTGAGPVRILVVFAGAKGTPNTVKLN